MIKVFDATGIELKGIRCRHATVSYGATTAVTATLTLSEGEMLFDDQAFRLIIDDTYEVEELFPFGQTLRNNYLVDLTATSLPNPERKTQLFGSPQVKAVKLHQLNGFKDAFNEVGNLHRLVSDSHQAVQWRETDALFLTRAASMSQAVLITDKTGAVTIEQGETTTSTLEKNEIRELNLETPKSGYVVTSQEVNPLTRLTVLGREFTVSRVTLISDDDADTNVYRCQLVENFSAVGHAPTSNGTQLFLAEVVKSTPDEVRIEFAAIDGGSASADISQTFHGEQLPAVGVNVVVLFDPLGSFKPLVLGQTKDQLRISGPEEIIFGPNMKATNDGIEIND